MKVVDNVLSEDSDFPELVLTIGSFDGIHLGHLKIIELLVEVARRRTGTAAVMTLRPHPREFFAPASAPNILTSEWKKEVLLAQAGVEVLFYLPFDAVVANMAPGTFVEEILVRRCRVGALVVGHDFAFGRDAAGNIEYLRANADHYRFEVHEVPALIIQGERVSSTLIREMILQGDVDKVETFLGRKYSIDGKVIRGRGMGRQLGFPTANIEPANKTIPAHGVYAAEAILNGEHHYAAVNIGIAPTIRHEDIMVEAHLLDFDRQITDERIEIIFHQRLRPEKKFDSYAALVAAIAADVREVRTYFQSGEGE